MPKRLEKKCLPDEDGEDATADVSEGRMADGSGKTVKWDSFKVLVPFMESELVNER